MRVAIISCPFQTSYGAYVDSLKQAIERKTGGTVQWLGSNCGCGNPTEVNRGFQIQGCQYFEMPNISDYRSTRPWRRWLRVRVRSLFCYFRARKYGSLSKAAELVHFQQILNAYGSDVVFHWLNQPSRAARVITVHELDSRQLESPERNQTYNKADAIIVHDSALRDQLVHLGVDPHRVAVVLHGTELPALEGKQPREGIIFYGGHHLMSGKGLSTLFKAMALLKKRMGVNAPKLKVHGHFGSDTPEEAKQLAREYGVENDIVWLNQITQQEIFRQYQTSLICVLPYSGGFAGFAASTAAAAELPVIATKNAAIPEHIGDCGIWVDNDNAEQLAERIVEVLGSQALRSDVARRLRKRAEEYLSWDKIADSTLAIYQQALRRRMESAN